MAHNRLRTGDCIIAPMPALMRRLNYRHIILGEHTERESVGVLTREGDYRYLPWIGFIEVERARSLLHARPVKLKIMAVSPTQGLGDWSQLCAGDHVQGCLVSSGVYGVMVAGVPRVIGATDLGAGRNSSRQ
jgi:hypothetical protein